MYIHTHESEPNVLHLPHDNTVLCVHTYTFMYIHTYMYNLLLYSGVPNEDRSRISN